MQRADAIGLFWQDKPTGRSRRAREMPPIPETNWRPPREFPNLSSARAIALDVETYDPELLDNGPGWARGKGHLIGVSLGAPGGGRWYLPMRHEVQKEDNLDPDKVLAYLRDTLSNSLQPKVGANLIYDFGWLREEGVNVAGDLIDVQYADSLLVYDTDKVNLDAMGQRYLGYGKTTEIVYQWCADYYGGKPDSSQRKNFYRAPPRLVGPYAEGDVDLPLSIAPRLYDELTQQGLYDIFRMECGLIRLLVEMRFAGVTIDLGKAEQLYVSLNKRIEEEKLKLDDLAGCHVGIYEPDTIARAFDRLGLRYPRTEKGKPSFTKGYLTSLEHPVAAMISDLRRLDKLTNTFIKSYMLESHVNGKLYTSFHPLRIDANGTRSGRLASSGPNLQNIPVRDKELGKLMRSIFIPDPGHTSWVVYDYSQIEYRFLVHYAIGAGSEEAREAYRNNPDTDYHTWTQNLIKNKTGITLPRGNVKTINFGIIYGMGEAKLGTSLNLSPKEAKEFLETYHGNLPFAKETLLATRREAETRRSDGYYITTILNRRSRFGDLWGPRKWSESQVPLPYRQALQAYGSDIVVALTHKALNRRLQGSAADLMKMAMYKLYNDGYFNEVGVPRLTVHDELDFSDVGGKDKVFDEIKHVMETAIPLSIPVRAEYSRGPDWGSAKG